MDSPLLATRELSRVYHARGSWRREPVWALREVSLELFAGETLALVGESGGGKTTLARILLGLLPPSSGEVWFDSGSRAARLPFPTRQAWRAFRSRVQLVSQDPHGALDPGMTLGDAIEEGYRVQRPELSASRSRELVACLLEEVGLAPSIARRRPAGLSGGEKRRAVLARAFAALGYGCPDDGAPRALVADEPTAGLDAVVRSQVLRFLDTQRQTASLALLLVSHDLDAVEALADRVAILHGGQVLEAGPAAEVLARPCHPYTRELFAARRLAPAHPPLS